MSYEERETAVNQLHKQQIMALFEGIMGNIYINVGYTSLHTGIHNLFTLQTIALIVFTSIINNKWYIP